MTHTEASLQIFFTNEYSRFRMINGNRQLNEAKINRIIKEISNGNDMRKYYPIQVKENGDRLDILDGQHRFYIARHFKSPVFYILVKEEKSMPDIAKINSNVEKWNANDFINCYVQQENENYKILQQFIDDYKINIGTCIKMLSDGNPANSGAGSSLKEKFQHGQFEAKFLQPSIDLIQDCLKFTEFPLRRDRNFISAIYRIKKAGLVKIDEIVESFKKRPDQLTRQIGAKEYVYKLEQLVNIGKQNRIIIA
jgi:hypothetical protein